MSTSEPRPVRMKNPAGKLTNPNNSATPELPSHVITNSRSVPTEQLSAPFPTSTTLEASPTTLTEPTPLTTAASSSQQGSVTQQSRKHPLDPDLLESDDDISTNDLPRAAEKGPTQKKKKVAPKSRGEYQNYRLLLIFLIRQFADDLDDSGMHKDVRVMDIDDSDAEGAPSRRKKVFPTADIDAFFVKVPHLKGDKRGRRKCNLCAYVYHIHS